MTVPFHCRTLLGLSSPYEGVRIVTWQAFADEVRERELFPEPAQ